MSRRMQASYALKLQCLAHQLKEHPVVPASKSGEANISFKYYDNTRLLNVQGIPDIALLIFNLYNGIFSTSYVVYYRRR
jgi:hypothetical protein